jgi:hypothetical protein
MTYCSACGSAFEEDARFCSYCGVKADEVTKDTVSPPSVPASPAEPPKPEPAARRETAAAPWDRPITAWGYFGWFVLFGIPVIGWLFFLLAVCGAFGNRYLTSMARGYMLYTLLWVIVIITAVLVLALITWGWFYRVPWQWSDWSEWWRQIPWGRW